MDVCYRVALSALATSICSHTRVGYARVFSARLCFGDSVGTRPGYGPRWDVYGRSSVRSGTFVVRCGGISKLVGLVSIACARKADWFVELEPINRLAHMQLSCSGSALRKAITYVPVSPFTFVYVQLGSRVAGPLAEIWVSATYSSKTQTEEWTGASLEEEYEMPVEKTETDFIKVGFIALHPVTSADTMSRNRRRRCRVRTGITSSHLHDLVKRQK